MIDIIKAKETFKNYVKNYNPEDKKIKLKISHIQRTSRDSKTNSRKFKANRRRDTISRINRIIA